MSRSLAYIIVVVAVLLATLEQATCNQNSLSSKLRVLAERRRPASQHGATSAFAAASGGGNAAAMASVGSTHQNYGNHMSRHNQHHDLVDPIDDQFVDPFYNDQPVQYAPQRHASHQRQPHQATAMAAASAGVMEPEVYEEAPRVVAPVVAPHRHASHRRQPHQASAMAAASVAQPEYYEELPSVAAPVVAPHRHASHRRQPHQATAMAAASVAEPDYYEQAPSVVAPVVAPAPVQAPVLPPQTPHRFNSQRVRIPRHRTRFGGQHGGAVAAASAATVGGASHGGAVAAASATGAHHPATYAEDLNQQYVHDDSIHMSENPQEQVYAASAGTYADDGQGHESSSYVRDTENVVKHEDGREDDNHYYKAQSYGKTLDENKHEAYNNHDEDIMQNGQMFRKKKTSTNWVSDYNKNRRESGSGVLAKDKHSSAYNKDTHRFKENVDRRRSRSGAGIVDNTSSATSNDFDDEDESYFDSDGLQPQAQYAPQPARYGAQGGAAAASSAVGGGRRGGSVATAASLRGGASAAAAGK